MKRKTSKFMFGVMGAMILGGAVTMQVFARSEAKPATDLMLANIEAMADGEVDAGYVRNITRRTGDEPGFWTSDGSQFCVPHWESTECYDEAPEGEWCQSHYTRTVNCH